MPIDIKTPDSPGWWLKRLDAKLTERRKRIDPLFDRFEGNPPLPVSAASMPAAAQAFYKTSRTNFYDMIVKSVRYRVRVARIMTGNELGDSGDAQAWRLWRRAGMLVEGPDVIRNMLVAGDGYVITAMDGDEAAATSEDPRQVVTIHDPVRQSRIRAAAKFFHDDDLDLDLAYLHRPGRVWTARLSRKTRSKQTARFSERWEWDETRGGEEGLALPAGFESAIMVDRVRNDEGVGDFERHTDIFDRIDHIILQGMTIATLQAFKQRAIKVSDEDMPDEDPDTGERIDYDDVLSADPGALWKLPASAELWESGAVDLTPITMMAHKEIERLSAVTFTPLSMFSPEGANQSATGASLVREGMTFKVEDKHDRVGAAFASVASKIFRLAGHEDIADPDAITIGWAPAERFSLTEKYTSAVQAKAAGVPWRTIMIEVLQFDPEQVDRMASERMADLLALPDGLGQGQPAPESGGGAEVSAADLKAKFDALGIAIRAGVDPEEAAQRVGMPGIKFTGERPVSLRPSGE